MPDTEFAPDALDVSARPQNVDDAREAIAQTRERISATLDAIELRIDETKQDIRSKVDVLRPARERISASPWTALGIAAGAGLVLGLLTGGGSEDEGSARRRHEPERGRRASRHDRGDGDPGDWIDRGEHMLRRSEGAVVRRGEELIDAMHGDAHADRNEHAHRHEPHRNRARLSMQERVVDHLLQALTGAISDGISSRIRGKLLD